MAQKSGIEWGDRIVTRPGAAAARGARKGAASSGAKATPSAARAAGTRMAIDDRSLEHAKYQKLRLLTQTLQRL